MKKSKIAASKPAPKTRAEQSAVTEAFKTTSQKTSIDQESSGKAQTVASKPVAAMSQRVGLTAGRIWHYLAKNGATSVSKLVRELPEEEEKVIQRSIGWLAQEGKIILKSTDRVETITLKD
jgi:TRAP-type uncharacterized transport system substrate-binding protein